ncbi:MAG: extracellular solute-binding protein [Bacteroidetes bacterium]|nr:extracellular solute-binding protein [Bacteroidota bacterium]
MAKSSSITAGYIFTISAFALFSACSNNNSSSSTSNDSLNKKVNVTDVRYIKIDDAASFLPSWSKENVLVYHDISEPDDMHPCNGLSVSRSERMGYTQTYIIGVDFQNLTPRPGCVKALPEISPDGLNFTYELRDDIKFDDGSPITVEDIIYTFKACKNPLTNNPHAKPYLDNLEDIIVDKTSPRKFTLKMKRKYIQNIVFLADYPIMQRTFFDKTNIMSKYTFQQFDDPKFKADQQKDLNGWAAEFNSAKYGHDPKFLVGAGPYYVEKWDAGQEMILARKKDHWSMNSKNMYETSFPDKIIFKLNKDQNSQILEFKSQALDATTSISTKTLIELQKDTNFNANYNARFTDTYYYGYMCMNQKPDGIKRKPIFTDKKTRRAIAMLVPLDDINKVVNKGKNKRIVGPVSPLKPEYNSDLKLIQFDIEGAKKLLDEAGWKDTDGDNIRDKMVDGKKIKFEFDLNYSNSDVAWKDISQMTSEAMYKAGVKANMNPLDFSVIIGNANNHDFDMMIGGWGGSFAPEDYTQIWHTSAWVTKGSNFGGFGNAESDAIIDSIKYEMDDNKRAVLVKKFQQIVYDEQPYVFMFSSLRRNVIHKRFGNQEMYFERPGNWLTNLKLLSNTGTSVKAAAAAN